MQGCQSLREGLIVLGGLRAACIVCFVVGTSPPRSRDLSAAGDQDVQARS
jgi:hypothetical protein